MTTHLSKNDLTYEIDFAENDDYLEVAQLFDEASEGLVKYYHDDIFNTSGNISIPSTGIVEFAKYMRTDITDITDVYSAGVDFDNGYHYKITNAVKATHRDKIVGTAVCLPHNNVTMTTFMTNEWNTEKKAHIQVCGTTPCMLRGSEKLVEICKNRISKNQKEPLKICSPFKNKHYLN